MKMTPLSKFIPSNLAALGNDARAAKMISALETSLRDQSESSLP